MIKFNVQAVTRDYFPLGTRSPYQANRGLQRYRLRKSLDFHTANL